MSATLPEPVVSDKIHTVDMSCRGDNSYYVACGTTERSQNYAVCLHVISKIKRGEPFTKDSFVDCRKAIACGSCPAIAMRAAEMEANRALYFCEKRSGGSTERPVVVTPRIPAWQGRENQSDSYRRGYDLPVRKQREYTPPERRPLPPPVRRPARDTSFDAAKLVNMVKNEGDNPSAQEDKEFMKRRPGESLVQYAKRLQERNK